MDKIIDSAIAALEKLLTVVNTPQRLLFLACLTGLLSTSYLGYYLLRNPSTIAQIVPAPSTIVRVGGKGCYQRLLIRRDSLTFVGLQFPLTPDMEKSGVMQNITGVILSKDISNAEFLTLCKQLVEDIESPNRQDFILNLSPTGKKRLIEYYKSLDNPVPLTPDVLKR